MRNFIFTYNFVILTLLISSSREITIDEYLNFATEFNYLESPYKHCITKPMYHGACENCSWAIAAASVFSDRICLKSKGQIRKLMSPYCIDFA